MNDRELRLRQRIDVLLDQRDALEQTVAACRQRCRRLSRRNYELTRSRDTWHYRWKVK